MTVELLLKERSPTSDDGTLEGLAIGTAVLSRCKVRARVLALGEGYRLELAITNVGLFDDGREQVVGGLKESRFLRISHTVLMVSLPSRPWWLQRAPRSSRNSCLRGGVG